MTSSSHYSKSSSKMRRKRRIPRYLLLVTFCLFSVRLVPSLFRYLKRPYIFQMLVNPLARYNRHVQPVIPSRIGLVADGNEDRRLAAPVPTLWRNDYNTVHVVHTRLHQHQAGLPYLSKARFKLFKTFCFPSMLQQSNQQFLWILWTDPTLDPESLQKTMDLVSRMPNVILLAAEAKGKIDNFRALNGLPVTDPTNDNGDEDEEVIKANRALLKNVVLAGNPRLLLDYQKASHSRLLVETKLDADDGLARHFVDSVQAQAARTLGQTMHNPQQAHIYCPEDHVEWRYFPTQNGDLLHFHNEDFCIQSGLSVAYHVEATNQQLFDFDRYNIPERLPTCEDGDGQFSQTQIDSYQEGNEEEAQPEIVGEEIVAESETEAETEAGTEEDEEEVTYQTSRRRLRGYASGSDENPIQAILLRHQEEAQQVTEQGDEMALNRLALKQRQEVEAFAAQLGTEAQDDEEQLPTDSFNEPSDESSYSHMDGEPAEAAIEQDDTEIESELTQYRHQRTKAKDTETSNACWTTLEMAATDRNAPFQLAVLLTRSPTVAGMKHVIPNSFVSRHSIEQPTFAEEEPGYAWDLMDLEFGVHKGLVSKMRARFDKNMEGILKDAISGQCNKGHSCLSWSKKALNNLLSRYRAQNTVAASAGLVGEGTMMDTSMDVEDEDSLNLVELVSSAKNTLLEMVGVSSTDGSKDISEDPSRYDYSIDREDVVVDSRNEAGFATEFNDSGSVELIQAAAGSGSFERNEDANNAESAQYNVDGEISNPTGFDDPMVNSNAGQMEGAALEIEQNNPNTADFAQASQTNNGIEIEQPFVANNIALQTGTSSALSSENNSEDQISEQYSSTTNQFESTSETNDNEEEMNNEVFSRADGGTESREEDSWASDSSLIKIEDVSVEYSNDGMNSVSSEESDTSFMSEPPVVKTVPRGVQVGYPQPGTKKVDRHNSVSGPINGISISIDNPELLGTTVEQDDVPSSENARADEENSTFGRSEEEHYPAFESTFGFETAKNAVNAVVPIFEEDGDNGDPASGVEANENLINDSAPILSEVGTSEEQTSTEVSALVAQENSSNNFATDTNFAQSYLDVVEEKTHESSGPDEQVSGSTLNESPSEAKDELKSEDSSLSSSDLGEELLSEQPSNSDNTDSELQARPKELEQVEAQAATEVESKLNSDNKDTSNLQPPEALESTAAATDPRVEEPNVEEKLATQASAESKTEDQALPETRPVARVEKSNSEEQLALKDEKSPKAQNSKVETEPSVVSEKPSASVAGNSPKQTEKPNVAEKPKKVTAATPKQVAVEKPQKVTAATPKEVAEKTEKTEAQCEEPIDGKRRCCSVREGKKRCWFNVVKPEASSVKSRNTAEKKIPSEKKQAPASKPTTTTAAKAKVASTSSGTKKSVATEKRPATASTPRKTATTAKNADKK